MEWQDAVRKAIEDLCAKKRRDCFTRQELIREHLDEICEKTGSLGDTPRQTLSRVLQELRDLGELKFLKPGRYRKLW